MFKLIETIKEGSVLCIYGKIYSVLEKVLYVTRNKTNEWYARIQLEGDHFLMIQPFEKNMYFGIVDRDEAMKDFFQREGSFEMEGHIYNKYREGYQLVKEVVFGDFLKAEGECMFEDYKCGDRNIRFKLLERGARRADDYGKTINIKDIQVINADAFAGIRDGVQAIEDLASSGQTEIREEKIQMPVFYRLRNRNEVNLKISEDGKFYVDTIIQPLPNDEMIKSLEDYFRHEFPKEYVDFLKKYSGIIPAMNVITCGKKQYYIDRFLCVLEDHVNDKNGWYDIEVVATQMEMQMLDFWDEETDEENDESYGMDTIPIARLTTEDYIYLDYRAGDPPCISSWYYDKAYGDVPAFHKIADSFGEFLKMLNGHVDL